MIRLIHVLAAVLVMGAAPSAGCGRHALHGLPELSEILTRAPQKVAEIDCWGAVSPDGRFLSHVDWRTGNIAIWDTTARSDRNLTNSGYPKRAGRSVFSSDGTELAYSWNDCSGPDCLAELRITGVPSSSSHSPSSRLVYRSNTSVAEVVPLQWLEGGYILALLLKKNHTQTLSKIAISDGTVATLRELGNQATGYSQISPDGQYLAYEIPEPETPDRDIEILSLGKPGTVATVQNVGDDTLLGWAPGGNRLLYANRGAQSVDAWLVDVADGKPAASATLVHKDIGPLDPRGFSSDGSFHYCRSSGSASLYLTDLSRKKGDAVQRIAKVVQKTAPEFSPDGKSIAYAAQRGASPGGTVRNSWALVIRSLETGAEREIRLPLRLYHRFKPRWAPDGSRVVAQGRAGNGQGLVTINTTTGALTQVTTTPAVWHSPGASETPGWSPDGTTVFFRRGAFDRNGRRDFSAHRLVALDLARHEEKDLVSGEFVLDVEVSPDGQRLALVTPQGVALVPASGGQPDLLKASPPHIFEVSWAPSEQALFLAQNFPDSRFSVSRWTLGTNQIEAIDGASGSQERLFGLSVHPGGRWVAFTAGKVTPASWRLVDFLPGTGKGRGLSLD